MTSWNFADLWELSAEVCGERRAAVHGDPASGGTQWSWTRMNAGANGLARTMLDAGVERQDKVAQYMYNCPEYMQSVFACFKASLVPVNTNYRYTDNELLYLWDNSDAAVVVFHGSFTATIENIRHRLPNVKLWLHVDDGTTPCPAWASDYAAAAARGTGENVMPTWGRAGSDLWFIYTGGTTGTPKGVMWEQDTLARLITQRLETPLRPETTIERWTDAVVASAATAPAGLPAAPLMHGTGQVTALRQLTIGGCVVTMANRSFDAEALLDTIERERVTAIAIVGDAFSRPVLDALDENPGRWDLSSLASMVSSGAMWSQSVKERLTEHMPDLVLFDSLGSSEALGMGGNYSSKGAIHDTAKFQLGEHAVVIDDDGRPIAAGSGEIGRIGVRGLLPTGYYKDEEKTAAAFPVIGGVRYSLPGDFATLEADGSITLLGRGSVCINTGGEKVFPEEVEEVLKEHPSVVDAIAVGIPDERFGQVIAAVVETPSSAENPTPTELIDHVKASLATFKAPRHIFTTRSLERAANGKVDYRKWTSFAEDQLRAAGG